MTHPHDLEIQANRRILDTNPLRTRTHPSTEIMMSRSDVISTVRETVHETIPQEGRGSLPLVVDALSTAGIPESQDISHHVAIAAIWGPFRCEQIDRALWEAALKGIVMAYDPRRL